MPVRLIDGKRFADARGWFTEVYSERTYAALSIPMRFVQDNHSLSQAAGTLRGLHFQTPPHAQAKLVRCVRGRIFDVAVDLRKGSPTYGQWTSAVLAEGTERQLYVPVGFAHGFLTLEPGTEVMYKVSDFYDAPCDGGVLWNDPAIAVPWPLAGRAPLLSAKDEALPVLAAFNSPFAYDGVPLASAGRELGP